MPPWPSDSFPCSLPRFRSHPGPPSRCPPLASGSIGPETGPALNKRAERRWVMFSTSVFSVDVTSIGLHCNPVPCALTGRTRSLTLVGRDEVVTGDILLIRPGIEHSVICSGGINVMYLDGLSWPGRSDLAERLEGRLA